METRSPIKGKTLRQAGESLEKEILTIQDDMLYKFLMYAVMFFTFACIEWLRFLTNAQPDPWPYTIVALIFIPYAIYRVLKLKQRVRQLQLGREGERAVGEFLNTLRSKGYAIYHDIVGEGFNIDHVIFAPSGIYTIETKTRSKPASGAAKVIVEKEKILVNGMEMDRDARIQASAQASWLKTVLKESTGKDFPIRPVVVFPGWYVENKNGFGDGSVWVLNPKALPAFIENGKSVIPDVDLHLASYHLSRLLRSQA